MYENLILTSYLALLGTSSTRRSLATAAKKPPPARKPKPKRRGSTSWNWMLPSDFGPMADSNPSSSKPGADESPATQEELVHHDPMLDCLKDHFPLTFLKVLTSLDTYDSSRVVLLRRPKMLSELLAMVPSNARVQLVTETGLLYIQPFAKWAILGGLSSVSAGALRIEGPEGQSDVLGSTDAEKPAVIKIHNEFFWVRVLLFGDIGFAQSYMLGEISSPDLVSVLEFFIHNSATLSAPTTSGLLSSIMRQIGKVTGRVNDIATARLNAVAHYSLSNDMFAAFLSPDMTYSAPLWLPHTDLLSKSDTLEEAQLRKLRYAISACHITEADHVLEIGTGWGSFAIVAATITGCRVTTVTPSEEQKKLTEQRVQIAGLTDKITVVQADYRELRLEDGRPFDKVVSIEMIEHVGHEFLDTYFECMDRYLKQDGGIGYFQCITMPEARYEEYAKSEDFIKKYIFPGGHLPTVSGLTASIARGSKGKLVVEEIRSVGAHYPRTLRCWKKNFQENFNSKIVPALLSAHPEMSRLELDIFKRKWEYYFTYCEAGFSTKSLGDIAITVGRENCVTLLEEF